MYLKFFGLAEYPFNLTPDSRFLFFSERHREALASVLYGVDQQKGFIVLTGAIGAGKTTVCRALLSELDKEGVRTAIILHSFLNELELLQAINDEFGLPADLSSKKALIDHLNRFLIAQRLNNINVVLLIDEAQNLSRDALEQLRMLSNLETETEKLIQIVLVGQPELNDILQQPDLEQFNQRVTVRYHLTPMSQKEMTLYIEHRLRVAQAHIDIEFTDEALDLIFNFSHGVPRKINLVCDRALLAGYVEGVYCIDEHLARLAIGEVVGGLDKGMLTGHPGRKKPRATLTLGWKGLFLLAFAFICVGGAVAMAVFVAGGVKPRFPHSSLGWIGLAPPTPTPTPMPTPSPTPAPAPPPPGEDYPPGQGSSDDTRQEESEAPASTGPPLVHASMAWRYQEGTILGLPVRYVRVRETQHALAGAFLTLIDAWGVNMDDIQPLQEGDENRALQAIAQFCSPGRKMRLVALNNMTFSEAMDFNMPLLLELDLSAAQDPRQPYPPFVTLLRAQGEALHIADPVYGPSLRVARKEELSPLVMGVTAVYLDPHGWSFLYKGLDGEAVETLERHLNGWGLLRQAPTGVYDNRLEEAIRRFQRRFLLEPTGALDPLTLLMLSLEADVGRPRLFPVDQ